jgi:glutamate synthase (NADPH/NADH) large chain
MFLVDFENGRIIADRELKSEITNRRPYAKWLRNQRLTMGDLPPQAVAAPLSESDRIARMRAFGYSTETMDFMLLPMIEVKKDPIGSMGNDARVGLLERSPATAV